MITDGGAYCSSRMRSSNSPMFGSLVTANRRAGPSRRIGRRIGSGTGEIPSGLAEKRGAWRKDSLVVPTLPRQIDRLLVDVRGEHLHVRRPLDPRHVFAQQDGDRVSFFARGAAGHPDAQWRAGVFAAEELGDDNAGERLE